MAKEIPIPETENEKEKRPADSLRITALRLKYRSKRPAGVSPLLRINAANQPK